MCDIVRPAPLMRLCLRVPDWKRLRQEISGKVITHSRSAAWRSVVGFNAQTPPDDSLMGKATIEVGDARRSPLRAAVGAGMSRT